MRPAILLLILGCLGWPPAPARAAEHEYAIGADLSFLRQAEQRGTVFKDEGQAKPGLQTFKDQ